MKHIIHLGDKPVVLIYKDFDGEIDVNEVVKIDYSNLYAESITVSVLLSRVVQLMSEAERAYETAKFKCSVLEANLEKRWRAEANKSNGLFTVTEIDDEGKSNVLHIKLTDKSIAAAVISDTFVIEAKQKEIDAKRNWGFLKGFVDGVKSKSKKLEFLLPKVTPDDFWHELVDGSICNLIEIRKPKK